MSGRYLTDTHPLIWHLTDNPRIPDASYRVASLDQATAKTMLEDIPWAAIPELADRIISSTAWSLAIPLITKDRRIIDSGLVETIW